MKKHLLFAAAALSAMAVYAADPAPESYIQTAEDAEAIAPEFNTEAPEFTPKHGMGVLKVPANDVFYRYPAGTFYSTEYGMEKSLNGSTISIYAVGSILLHPYNSYLFEAINPSDTPSWTTAKYDSETKTYIPGEPTEGNDYVVTTKVQSSTLAPTMTIGDYDFGSKCFKFASNTNTEYDLRLHARGRLADNHSGITIPVAGGWCANTTRQGGVAGHTYITGTRNVIDEKGDTTKVKFNYYGSGSSRDALGSLFLAPNQPYVSNGVYILCNGYIKNPTYLTVELWTVLENECPYDTIINGVESVAWRNPVLGEKLVETKAFLDTCGVDVDGAKTTLKDGKWYGLIKAPFTMEDEWGTYEYSLVIDQPVMIVVTGFNDNPDLENFYIYQNKDNYNDGISRAYIGWYVGALTGKPDLNGAGHWFTNKYPAAPSIYMDVELPWIVTNYSTTPDSITMPNTGGSVEFKYNTDEGEKVLPLEFYSYRPFDGNVEPCLVDGSELPEWLTVECSDLTKTNDDGDEEYTNVTDVLIDVDPLPADVKGRSAQILFEYPGAQYVFTVVQGEPDGIEGITTDGNVVGTEMFNLQGQRVNSANATGGLYIVKSINADGTSTATKVIK